MSPTFKYTISLGLVIFGAYNAANYFRAQTQDDDIQLSSLRAQHSDLTRKLETAKAAVSKKDQEGTPAAFDYNALVEKRGQIQIQVRRSAEEFGLNLQQRDFGKSFEFIVTGPSYQSVLKFCHYLEKNMKEMRPKMVSWGPEQEGNFSVGFSYELLPITKPNASGAGKKNTSK